MTTRNFFLFYGSLVVAKQKPQTAELCYFLGFFLLTTGRVKKSVHQRSVRARVYQYQSLDLPSLLLSRCSLYCRRDCYTLDRPYHCSKCE